MSVQLFEKLPWNKNLVLCSPDLEGTGTLVRDTSKSHINCVLSGVAIPTWVQLASGKWVLNFDGTWAYLQCPAADSVALNFTSEDWTMMAWTKGDAGAASADMIMCQGAFNAKGWEFYVFWDTLSVSLRTNQAAAHTGIQTAEGLLVKDVWQLLGVTRHGASGQFYINGLPVTTILNGGLTDPVSSAGTKILYVGCQDGAVGNFWKGYMGKRRIYSGKALTDAEMMLHFIQSKGDYGL